MLARLLYGGGLALVAAQLFAQGHHCGPGCSGSGNYYQQAPHAADIAPLPSDFGAGYSHDHHSGALIDPRMMRPPVDAYSQSQRSRSPRSFRSPAAGYQSPAQGHLGHHDHWGEGDLHRRRPGGRHAATARPQGNDAPSGAGQFPPRNFTSPPMQSPSNEDMRPMPQPSWTSPSSVFRELNPAPETLQQPWSSQRPATSLDRPIQAWNI